MSRVDVLPAREVPLGGLRAMSVARALPQRGLPTVGAWCFLDRFGPERTAMVVDPHPHMGLQTVTWPLAGQVRHRDSLGSDVVLRPGALNLMTSGAGIAHSEYSLGAEPDEAAELLDAVQFWIALPESARHGERGFEQHANLPMLDLPGTEGEPGGRATVVIGTLGGVTSPATTYTPLVGAHLMLDAGARVSVPLDPTWEHALVALEGDLSIVPAKWGYDEDEVRPERNALAYLGFGRVEVTIASERGASVFLLGGEPLEEELVMWWNFVGRSHEEIVAARDAWQQRSPRFGEVAGHEEWIPAPPLPNVRLTPRGAPLRRDARLG